MNQSVLGLYFEDFEVGAEIEHALSIIQSIPIWIMHRKINMEKYW